MDPPAPSHSALDPSQLTIQGLLEQLAPQIRAGSPFNDVTGLTTPSRHGLNLQSPPTPFTISGPVRPADSGDETTPLSSPCLGRSNELPNSSPTSSPLRSSSGASSIVRKKARATRKNPTCGHVVGAMRGAKKLGKFRLELVYKSYMLQKRFYVLSPCEGELRTSLRPRDVFIVRYPH